MLSVAEAQTLILNQARSLPPALTPLTPATLGLVLAEDIASDLDMPPYDKAMMDGFAVRSADLPEGRGILTVIEEVTAGRIPQRSLNPGQATRIMTGAPLPSGADAIVMVEYTRPVDDQRVQIEDRPPQPGRHIMRQGQEMRAGEVVLTAGTILRPQEFGLLATVGRTVVKANPAPRVAILSTGDEIVEPALRPALGQIRNSNGPLLEALVERAGGVPHNLGIARDQRESLQALVIEGLQAPVLVLSGGVSAGKLDLVPEVLQEAGVRAHFHKVAMKPGKPVLFGTRDKTLVFGLPGNPVSALVCFELFVRPALRQLSGHVQPGPFLVRATLQEDFAYHSDRLLYHPAWLELTEGGWHVRSVPWLGSPDLRSLTRANALLVLAAGELQLHMGNPVTVLRMEL